MPNAATNIEKAEKFLRHRFIENAKHYGGSFAQALNNDAAVQLAEVFFGVDTAQKAKESLGAEREPHPAEP